MAEPSRAGSERYAALVADSRAEYEQRLNWDSWGIEVNQVTYAVLANKRSPLAEPGAEVSID